MGFAHPLLPAPALMARACQSTRAKKMQSGGFQPLCLLFSLCNLHIFAFFCVCVQIVFQAGGLCAKLQHAVVRRGDAACWPHSLQSEGLHLLHLGGTKPDQCISDSFPWMNGAQCEMCHYRSTAQPLASESSSVNPSTPSGHC